MKTKILVTFLFLGIIAIGGIFFIVLQMGKEDNDEIANQDQPKGEELAIYNLDGELMFSLNEFSSKYGLTWEYDSFEGTIELYDKNHNYFFLKGTPVVAVDGVYKPINAIPYIDNDQIYLNLDVLDKVLDYRYESIEGQQTIEVFASEDSLPAENIEFLNFQNHFPNMTDQEIISYLSFLSVPLEGAHLTTQNSQLPGAPRDYRNGNHEGIDWYAYSTGINITKNTPVKSMATGIVVRADHDYIELSYEERDEILNISANSNHTPQYILDRLRGRTVWVQYDNGVMVRYAHLSRIENNIEIGTTVQTGQIIGYVGNSGTSYGIDGNDIGLHLHSDILIYNNLFWEYFDDKQIRSILETIFPKS